MRSTVSRGVEEVEEVDEGPEAEEVEEKEAVLNAARPRPRDALVVGDDEPA